LEVRAQSVTNRVFRRQTTRAGRGGLRRKGERIRQSQKVVTPNLCSGRPCWGPTTDEAAHRGMTSVLAQLEIRHSVAGTIARTMTARSVEDQSSQWRRLAAPEGAEALSAVIASPPPTVVRVGWSPSAGMTWARGVSQHGSTATGRPARHRASSGTASFAFAKHGCAPLPSASRRAREVRNWSRPTCYGGAPRLNKHRSRRESPGRRQV
jgi:hypothetical protein